MSNFTRSGGRAKFWQSATNLSCCSIDSITKQLSSMKAFAFIAIFLFSMSSMLGQSTERTVFFNRCFDNIPPAPFSLSEVEALFQDECPNGALTIDLDENISGNNCDWTATYTYFVKCDGVEINDLKIIYFGGDRTAPALIGGFPDDQSNLNLCFDEIPAGPTEAEIAAYYADNCGGPVTVTKTGTPTGDNCSWAVTYDYEISDECGNKVETKIEYSGGDTEAPELIKDAEIPTGASNLNLCFAVKSQGPTVEEIAALFEDNCSSVITVTKTEYSKGTDCKWMAIYDYTIQDECGNFAAPISITYQGGDTEAPVLVGVPEDLEVECLDLIPASADVTGTDNCTEDLGKIDLVEDYSNLGIACAGGYITRTWTATDDCGHSTSATQTITVKPAPAAEFDTPQDFTIDCGTLANFQPPTLHYDNGVEGGACQISGEAIGTFDPFVGSCGSFVVSYFFMDECERTINASLTVTVEDNTAPVIEPSASNLTVECDGAGNAAELEAWLASHGGASATDNCGNITWTNNFIALSDDCGATGFATVEFTATDDCGNDSKTTATFTIVDTTNPEITPASDMTVECDGEGNSAELQAWLANHGGATASDVCGDVTWSYNCGQSEEGDFTRFLECTFPNGSNGSIAFGNPTGVDENGRDIFPNGTALIDGFPIGSFIYSIVYNSGQSRWEVYEGNTILWYNSTLDTSPSCNVADYATAQNVIDNGGCVITNVTCTGSQGNGGNGVCELSDECGATGSLTVEFTATDSCGNESKTTATFTIVDTTNPDITPASDMTVECDGAGNLNALNTWLANHGGATSQDDCSEITWSDNFEALSDECGATGSATVEFTATDACGNSSKTTATFTIQDTHSPPITNEAQDLTVDCDGEGNLEELQAWLDSNAGAIAHDICSEITWSNNFNGLSDLCGATGSATVLFTVTDDCGLSSSTSATFTIQDITDPTITPASNMTVECDGAGNLNALNSWLANHGGATASDACSDIVWSDNFDALSDLCGATGSATVEFTATDDCGNASKTTATFTIVDTTNPSIDNAAEDLTVECDGAGNAAELEAWLASNGGALASDGCGGISWSNDFVSLSDECGATGSAQVVFTVTDECGNTSKTEATFTIEDTTDPVITPASDMTVECDGEGNSAELQAWLANHGGATASDVCSGVVWSDNFEALSDECGATGSATVEFTATDDCGNSSKTTATFTIVDTTNPDITPASDMTVECDGEGNNAQLQEWLANNGGATASDICGDVTWSNSCGSSNNGGIVFDCVVNNNVFGQTIFDAPIGYNEQGYAIYGLGDGDYPNSGGYFEDFFSMSFNSDLNRWEVFQQETLIWISNVDAFTPSCNTADWQNAGSVCQIIDVHCGQGDGEGSSVCELSDECGATGSVTVEFTATDSCGNESKTTATFTIIDTTDPVIDTPSADLTVECDGSGNTEQLDAWLESHGGATGYDACGEVTWSNNFDALSDLCGATGTATVEFTLTDACGNDTKTTATFTIVDTTDPTITPAMDMTVECDGSGNAAELAAWLDNHGGATAEDACSGVVWSDNFDALSDLCGATGSATVEFTATDDCGNASKTTATFTIEDTTNPVFTSVPADLLLECDETAPDVNATAEDTCGSATVTYADYYEHTPWTAIVDGGDGSVDLSALPNGFTTTSSDTGSGNSYISVATTMVKNVNLSFDINFTTGDPGFEYLIYVLNGVETILASSNASGPVSVDLSPGDQFSIGVRTDDDIFGNSVAVISNIVFTQIPLACPLTDCFIREFTAVDECGNVSLAHQVIRFQDTTAPVIAPMAADLTVECDGEGNTAQLEAWLASHGGASATDNCSEVFWSHNFDGLSDECGATGSATVEFTVKDACDNATKTTATFTIVDTTNPDITPASDLTVECDGEGNNAQLQEWLANHGGATASDTCSDITWSNSCGQGEEGDFTRFLECTFPNGSNGSIAFGNPTGVDENGRDIFPNGTALIDGLPIGSFIYSIVYNSDQSRWEVYEGNTILWYNSTLDTSPSCNVADYATAQNVIDNGGCAITNVTCTGSQGGGSVCELSDECGATGSVTVEFTATDSCGNESKTTATFTIIDTTDPVIDTPSADLTVECDGSGNTEQLDAWLESHGGATGYDACGEVTWSNNFDALSDLCGATGTATVEFTLTDACGNDSKTTATFTIVDTIDPEITPAADLTVECDGSGNAAELEAWLANHGGATATDTCSGVVWSDNFDTLSDECGATGSVTVEFTATDDCGNSSKSTATFTIEDTVAPVLTGVIPSGQSNVNVCFANIPQGPTEEEMAALYYEACGDVVVTKTSKPLGDDCSWAVLHRYEISDECGNMLPPVKIYYNGGDKSAPVLTGTLPTGVTGLQCLSENPGAPKLEDIQAAFTDNCGTVTVTPLQPVISGNDCGWTATYTYTVQDACNNFAANVVVTHSGADTMAPVLTGTIPMGQNSLDLCLSNAPEGPSIEDIAAQYTDNCGNVEVTKTSQSYGDDCSWIKLYVYQIMDGCGNYAEEVKVYYNGGDQTAPVVTCPEDQYFGINPDLDANGLPYGLADKASYTDNCEEAGQTQVYTDSDITSVENSGGGVFTIECYVAQGDLFDYMDYVQTGTDGNGLPTYTGTLRNNGATPYPLYFNQSTNRWEGYLLNGTTLIWYADTLSCDVADWTNNNTSICEAIAIDCSNFIPTTDYSFVRTFTHTDACGNVGECSVTYSWSIVAPAGDIACGGVINGDTSNSSSNTVPFCGTTLTTAPGNFYTFIGTGDFVTVSTCSANTTYDTKIGVFTDAAATCVAGNDDAGCTHSNLHSTASFVSELGREYQIYVTGFGTSAGAFELSVSCEAVPECELPIIGTLECGDVATGDTSDAGDEDVAGPNGGTGNWYSFIGTGANVTTFSTCENTDYDSRITVFTNCIALSQVADNDDSCGLQSEVNFFAADGVEYFIFVRGYSSSTGEYQLNVTCGEQSPVAPEAKSAENVELDFRAYPVPFDNEVFISYSFDFETNVTIELYDTKGLLILSEANNNYKAGSKDKTRFDLSRTANQMFYVKVTTSQGSVTKKIVSSSPNRR